jgi:portal protein
MPEDKEKFIALARKRFQQASDDEKLLRQEAEVDLKFVAGDQWNPALKQQRENAGRPALTFPRCHTFVQQVSNEARQNKPQIKFAPDDEAGDEDTAEVYEGLARHIQYASTAQVAYETAVEYSAGGSFGYFRFLTKWCENDDFQELCIDPVLDPFAVYGILVPACFNREPKFAFVVEDIPKEEFEALYPDSAIVEAGWDEAGKEAPGWVGTETCRVAEYWYCTEEKVEGKRKPKTIVHYCKMTGMEVLPKTETIWPGYCIPIIPVLGKTMILKGKPIIQSVVRHQRGAQEMINYAKTRIAETLATSPISPFMVARGQIAKGDKKWENLNTQVYPYLEYDAVDVLGKPAPPPQRQTFEPPVAALSGFVAQEIDDMKATTGIFDASLGQKSNEQSGQAILRRQQQSNMTTMHFMDNLGRAFQKGGDIMADVIPKIYDTERMIRILGEDEAPKIQKINAPYEENGKQRHYKVGGENAGKYHVIVTMGRAFSTKRMESFDMMSQVLQGNPQLLPMIGDIFFRNSDLAGADQLAERFKKMLPPNLQDQDSDDPEAKLQALQAQLQQAGTHLQAINAYAQQLEKEKEGKVIEQQAKIQITQLQELSKQEIVKMQEATKLAVAQINASKDANQAFAEAEIEQFKILHGSAHERGMQAEQQSHEQNMADKQAQIAAQQADQSHQQTLEQQANQAALEPEPVAAGE